MKYPAFFIADKLQPFTYPMRLMQIKYNGRYHSGDALNPDGTPLLIGLGYYSIRVETEEFLCDENYLLSLGASVLPCNFEWREIYAVS